MRVYTRNNERTIGEMNELFHHLVSIHGEPSAGCWTYGKDAGFLDNAMCNGPFDIEYIDFKYDEDAAAFILRYG